jgi:hypothetical protein
MGMLREADLVTQTPPLFALSQLRRQVPLPLVSASAPECIYNVIRTDTGGRFRISRRKESEAEKMDANKGRLRLQRWCHL